MTRQTAPGSAARDAAATQQRILAAATEEFAAHGFAGARVATIATRAPANPRMIYAYFGSKEGLFRAVIERAVLQMQDAVTLDATDLPAYAQAVFDACKKHPHLVRLALWQGLELPGLSHEIAPVRRANEEKTAAIRRAQLAGQVNDTLPAAQLLDAILTLTYGNLVLAQGIGDYSDARRACLALAVELLTDPR
ncbi:TetR family transcriptional regulator [Streptomyces sp. NPDC007206]|uniref:TetR/AcrR family transcriptional regulator n=1 Tax=Streptomyces sp. NPDC007206 TaxID=3154317 RepID=UPI0033D938F1